MRVLLVEDNYGDIVLIQRAVAQANRSEGQTHITHVDVVRDGVEAIEYLTGDAPRPNLVLLDMDLPKKSGAEVLAFMKAHETLRRIPVVVLTGSANEAHVRRMFDLHCQAYCVKPGSMRDFRDFVAILETWWFRFGRIPRA